MSASRKLAETATKAAASVTGDSVEGRTSTGRERRPVQRQEFLNSDEVEKLNVDDDDLPIGAAAAASVRTVHAVSVRAPSVPAGGAAIANVVVGAVGAIGVAADLIIIARASVNEPPKESPRQKESRPGDVASTPAVKKTRLTPKRHWSYNFFTKDDTETDVYFCLLSPEGAQKHGPPGARSRSRGCYVGVLMLLAVCA